MKNPVTKIENITPELIAEVKTLNKTPVEMGEALKAKLKPVPVAPVVAAVAPVAPVAPVKQREVIEFGKRAKVVTKPSKEQSNYENRAYMKPTRFADKLNPDEVTHLTSHTTEMLLPAMLPALKEMYAKRSPANAMFTAAEIERHFNIFGPAKGDICRKAFKQLEKDGKVKTHAVQLGKVTRYTFELLDLPKTA
jgi:hypothetical protein